AATSIQGEEGEPRWRWRRRFRIEQLPQLLLDPIESLVVSVRRNRRVGRRLGPHLSQSRRARRAPGEQVPHHLAVLLAAGRSQGESEQDVLGGVFHGWSPSRGRPPVAGL